MLTLFFQAKPTISINQTEISVNTNENFTVTCHGNGLPPVNVYWNVSGLKSAVEMTSSDDVVTLHATKANVLDNGWIACYAENAVSRTSKTVRVYIHGMDNCLFGYIFHSKYTFPLHLSNG